VGVNEVAAKDLEDVVEVARAAKEESGVTFVHFNSGYKTNRDLDIAAHYVKAVKSRVGALAGVQLIPTLNFWKYDQLIDLGTDHFSFCYEFHNPEFFTKLLPGKQKLVGQEAFFRTLEYTSRKAGFTAQFFVGFPLVCPAQRAENTRRMNSLRLYWTFAGSFTLVPPIIGIFSGALIGYGAQRWSFAYNADVVAARLAALEKGVPGEEYLLAADNRSLNDSFQVLTNLSGVRHAVLHLPFWAGKLMGGIGLARAKLTGRPPQLTPGAVEIFKHDWVYSSDKAVRELGYRVTPFEEGLGKTLEALHG